MEIHQIFNLKSNLSAVKAANSNYVVVLIVAYILIFLRLL